MSKQKYTISDALKVLNVSRGTYFNWEKAGKIPRAKRDPMSNYRIFYKEDLDKLKRLQEPR